MAVMVTKRIGFGIAAAVVSVAASVGVYSLLRQPVGSNPQEDAIRQAERYKPDGFCTQALVPAVHEATGARYTFPNGCLAPGWVAERQ